MGAEASQRRNREGLPRPFGDALVNAKHKAIPTERQQQARNEHDQQDAIVERRHARVRRMRPSGAGAG